jgi:predicted aspartyl protease
MTFISRINLISRAIALFPFAFTLSATAASPGENTIKVRFPTDPHFMVVVPVSIDGAGPFNFLLDTGDTTTIIDRKLADQLSLPLVGEKEVTGVEAKLRVSIAHSMSISVAGATVRNLNVNVLPSVQVMSSEIRGILGEDFLGNFDLLIDNRHHFVQLELGPGPMSDMFEGERLPVSLEGNMNGESTNHRLIIIGYSIELSDKAISLQLDSGANFLYLFGGPESLGAGATRQKCIATTISNPAYQFSGYQKKLWQLRLGQKKVANVMAFALPQPPGKDTDGLMPTSAFHSIFISHSQKFVILDPTPKPMSVEREMVRFSRRGELFF